MATENSSDGTALFVQSVGSRTIIEQMVVETVELVGERVSQITAGVQSF
jgi:hypothetical protein